MSWSKSTSGPLCPFCGSERSLVVGEVAQVGSACTLLLVYHDALGQGAHGHAVQVEVVESLLLEIMQGELVDLRADNVAGAIQRHGRPHPGDSQHPGHLFVSRGMPVAPRPACLFSFTWVREGSRNPKIGTSGNPQKHRETRPVGLRFAA